MPVALEGGEGAGVGVGALEPALLALGGPVALRVGVAEATGEGEGDSCGEAGALTEPLAEPLGVALLARDGGRESEALGVPVGQEDAEALGEPEEESVGCARPRGRRRYRSIEGIFAWVEARVGQGLRTWRAFKQSEDASPQGRPPSESQPHARGLTLGAWQREGFGQAACNAIAPL